MDDLWGSAFVFPQEPPTSHILVRAMPEQPLQNSSGCLRSFTHLTRPQSLFSCTTKSHSTDILLSKSKPNQYQFSVGGNSSLYTVPRSLGESEHVCASWESTTGIVGFCFNGKPWPREGLQKGYVVDNKASIVLGQGQGGFEGEMSSVYMWDTGTTTSGWHRPRATDPRKCPSLAGGTSPMRSWARCT
ncbi:Mucosal pentraxin [Willisornis vidua]|uniref:Pentraxin family member n=1 Tax=Willisornis vidua TaxID=1566151 RepID=A0ABQ9DN68_9PASS|nr:Mucosal pentraxin [Willisornis vidua]